MEQTAIEGVALVGSHANGTAGADSDIDLMILSTNRGQYLQNQEWLSLFGRVNDSWRETWGCVETVRAMYETIEVEYGFAPPTWAGIPIDEGTMRVVSAGMTILLDRECKLEALRQAFFAARVATN